MNAWMENDYLINIGVPYQTKILEWKRRASCNANGFSAYRGFS